MFKKSVSFFILVFFLMNSVVPPGAQAQSLPAFLNLPAPGAMLSATATYNLPVIMGVNLRPEDSLMFDFIIDKGDSGLEGEEFNDEANKLIKYFLAALTTPQEHMWVNLSPYESGRIIPEVFGRTEMGRDMLAQDYILKQLSASLLSPEEALGEVFWTRFQTQAQAKFGSSDVPLSVFNKIWIVPQVASIYEHAKGAYIVESKLKVMLEQDYLASDVNRNSTEHGLGAMTDSDLNQITGIAADIIREILLPEIEREVNEGRLFAPLRQIFHSMLLAKWYKDNLKESLLGQIYADQSKTAGVDTDPSANQHIYDAYLKAFETGAYNYMKEEYDPATQSVIPKKYFSGGITLAGAPNQAMLTKLLPSAARLGEKHDLAMVTVRTADAAMIVVERQRTMLDELNDSIVQITAAPLGSSSPAIIALASKLTSMTAEQMKSDLTTPPEMASPAMLSRQARALAAALVLLPPSLWAQLPDWAGKFTELQSRLEEPTLEQTVLPFEDLLIDKSFKKEAERLERQIQEVVTRQLENSQATDGFLADPSKFPKLASVVNGLKPNFKTVFTAIQKAVDRDHANGDLVAEIGEWTSAQSTAGVEYDINTGKLKTILESQKGTCVSYTLKHLLLASAAGIGEYVHYIHVVGMPGPDGTMMQFPYLSSDSNAIGHVAALVLPPQRPTFIMDQGNKSDRGDYTIILHGNHQRDADGHLVEMTQFEVSGQLPISEQMPGVGQTLEEVYADARAEWNMANLYYEVKNWNSTPTPDNWEEMARRYNELSDNSLFVWNPVERKYLETIKDSLEWIRKSLESGQVGFIVNADEAAPLKTFESLQNELISLNNRFNENNADPSVSPGLDALINTIRQELKLLPKDSSLTPIYQNLITQAEELKLMSSIGVLAAKYNRAVNLFNVNNRDPEVATIMQEVFNDAQLWMKEAPPGDSRNLLIKLANNATEILRDFAMVTARTADAAMASDSWAKNYMASIVLTKGKLLNHLQIISAQNNGETRLTQQFRLWLEQQYKTDDLAINIEDINNWLVAKFKNDKHNLNFAFQLYSGFMTEVILATNLFPNGRLGINQFEQRWNSVPSPDSAMTAEAINQENGKELVTQLADKFLSDKKITGPYSHFIENLISKLNAGQAITKNQMDNLFIEYFTEKIHFEKAFQLYGIFAYEDINYTVFYPGSPRLNRVQFENKWKAANDAAMKSEVGGIDFNPAIVEMKVFNDGEGFQVIPPTLKEIRQFMDSNGFVPVIINVQPVVNLPMLLGMVEETPNPTETTLSRL